MDRVLLTIPEVAEATALGRSKVYELVAAGKIESVQIGRARRVPRDAVERFVDGLRAGGGAA
jgi:excisionase family DNA binding protein